MAPFTYVSVERPTRFADGTFGVLYVAEVFETALLETMHHRARFMTRTWEPPGWTTQFRELLLSVDARLHDLRAFVGGAALLDPEDYRQSRAFGARLRESGANGIVYPSVRHRGGICATLFSPDLTSKVIQGRHLDYH